MKPISYFSKPLTTQQSHYEALRAFYVNGEDIEQIISKFNFTHSYFKKLRFFFKNQLKQGHDPFFIQKKRGPQQRRTSSAVVEQIIALRKQNHSIADIKANLHSKNHTLSLDAVDQILKKEGFAPLPKRTRTERLKTQIPENLSSPKSAALIIQDDTFTTEMNAGPLVFLPLLEDLGIVKAIINCGFPSTKDISDVQYVLSFLAIKLMGGRRWSYDTTWNFDKALGFFAGLNVLPKSTSLSTYSYRVSRRSNLKLLLALSNIFDSESDGEFNLDFKAIPHWGDMSVLEKNWCGSKGKAIKSILSVLVQNPQSGMLSYTDAEVKHCNQNNAIIEFVDFWKTGHGNAPKTLIFDSKFTTYENLNRLNKDGIMFLTLRRRGKNLIARTEAMSEKEWQTIQITRTKGKKCNIRVSDNTKTLRHYDGKIREIIITDNTREKPTFLITNDLKSDVRTLVKKYANRGLVEQEIAEQVAFFQLNNPSSSIVVKVDFDLTLSLLAHNLYRRLAIELNGFERCTANTICRQFLTNGAQIQIKNNHTTIHFKKKTHLPILLNIPWLKKTTHLSWLNAKINYVGWTTN